jgi:hypothetical protein
VYQPLGVNLNTGVDELLRHVLNAGCRFLIPQQITSILDQRRMLFLDFVPGFAFFAGSLSIMRSSSR